MGLRACTLRATLTFLATLPLVVPSTLSTTSCGVHPGALTSVTGFAKLGSRQVPPTTATDGAAVTRSATALPGRGSLVVVAVLTATVAAATRVLPNRTPRARAGAAV